MLLLLVLLLLLLELLPLLPVAAAAEAASRMSLAAPKRSSSARGMMPFAVALEGSPSMVCVLPLPVCP